jgi:hypothetical protein
LNTSDCSNAFPGDKVFSSNLNAVFKLSFILGVKVHLFSKALSKFAFPRHIIVAVVLMLALLSGIIPFGSASAGHLCTMECCAGLAPHAARSCHMSMSPNGRSEESLPDQDLDKHCGLPQADNGALDGVDAGVMGMTDSAHSSSDLDDLTIDASDHCNTDLQSKDLNNASHNDSSESDSVATQFFSKPCPAECGTGAVSSGVRRSRDSVAVVYHARSRPPAPGRKYQHFNGNFLITSNYCRQLRPRGPPLSFT